MSFQLAAPPSVKDERYDQWSSLMWKYLLQVLPAEQNAIEASQIFSRRNQTLLPVGIQSTDAQGILVTQIFGG